MSKTRKLVILSLFLAIAIILNIVENMTFNIIFIPGIKLGLANISTIFILYYFGYKEMFVVNVLRITIASLITGTLFAIPFIISITSSLLSMVILYIFLKPNKLSVYGISIVQACLFNLFQILVVSYLYQTSIFIYYLPYLILSGIATGFLVAISASYIVKSLHKIV